MVVKYLLFGANNICFACLLRPTSSWSICICLCGAGVRNWITKINPETLPSPPLMFMDKELAPAVRVSRQKKSSIHNPMSTIYDINIPTLPWFLMVNVGKIFRSHGFGMWCLPISSNQVLLRYRAPQCFSSHQPLLRFASCFPCRLRGMHGKGDADT